MGFIKSLKKTIREIKKDAYDIEEKELIGFCAAFFFVGALMCIVNLLVSSYRMALITGIISLIMGGTMYGYRRSKKVFPVMCVLGSTVFAMMTYFLVNGGEHGFSIIWIMLVPPISVCFFQLYYGGLFSIFLGLVTTVYMWTPLHELGYEYSETYLIRFPIVYIVNAGVSLMILYQRWNSKREQKEAYRKIKEADAAKGIFLSNMSHEARTPINAVLGYNEMILNESKESNTLSYATNTGRRKNPSFYCK